MPEQPDHLAGPDGEVHTIVGDDRPEPAGEPADPQDLGSPMDRNLAALGDDDWDPFDHLEHAAEAAGDAAGEDAEEHGFDGPEAADAMRGFALATLEFIATAARDERLAAALLERVQVLLGAYTRVARRGRPDDETLPAEDVGALLAALDQGTAMLALTGIVPADAGLLRTGLRRLVDPARAAREGPVEAPEGPGPLHDPEIQRRVLRDVGD